jgi:parafibromin
METIAALRAKRLAKKRNTIIDADADLGKDGGDEPGTGQSFQSLMQYDSKLTKEIIARERVYRTRLTILQASGKNFAKTVFPILQSLKAREEAAKKPQIPGATPIPSSLHTPSIPTNPVTGQRIPVASGLSSSASLQQQYNRYDQERFTRNDAGGFRIDTTGTYHGLTLKSVTEGSLPNPQTPSNSAGVKPVQSGQSPNTPKKRTSRTPIIIVPATTTSLITVANATSILQHLKFVEAAASDKKENDIHIMRNKSDGTNVPFRVLDNPNRLSPEDWDRVVAVFVQGPAWQFKGWPWDGNPVEIFSRIKAFHLKFDEMKLDANVAKWSVSVLQVSRHKRHLDRANLNNFWSQLDAYMMKSKPHLKF